MGLGKKWGDYRLATRQIPAFIIENKNPGKYKKYNLAVVVNVAQKTGMLFLKHYKIANQKVKYRLARNKSRKKRATREQKEKEDRAIKLAQQKAEQKARAKREMSTLSSFKNARGKWGIKFGMTKRQVGASSKICTYYHNKRNPRYSSVSCVKELFGLKRTIYLSYRKNKVSGITVYLGKHTYSEWTKLHKILSRKYKVNYKANASDREMYNNKNTSRYLNLYDNGRILLQVSRECEKRGGKYSNYKCLWHRNVTKLVYWDDIEAKAFMKLIKKRSKKEDL